MNLGQNSVSLSVKDIRASRAFYENMGFQVLPNLGSEDENWLILKNGNAVIGLFQGMFEGNILTFNPQDARSIYKGLIAAGVEMSSVSDSIKEEKGPCHFVFKDPDGNTILIDQHNE